MQLGMGRTPVREALLRLQNEGIIVCNSRHNYRVRILTAADIKEIYETLGVLEGRQQALFRKSLLQQTLTGCRSTTTGCVG